MRALFLFLYLASLVYSEEIQVKLMDQWPNGFKMKISHVISQSVRGGWRMTLKFSKPVGRMQFPNAHQVSATQGNRVFCLKNRQYNGNLQAGSKLEMEFIGEKAVNNEAAPSATLEFHPGSDAKCDLSPPPTVIPPGATPPVQETSTAELVEEWPNGFKMNISILMQQKVEGGWKMTLRFPIAVKSLQTPKAFKIWRSPNRKVYILGNRPHNAFLEKCSRLEMIIIGRKRMNSEAPSEAAIEFRRKENWIGGGGGGGCVPSTTQPPTTTEIPVTTKPPATTESPTNTEPPEPSTPTEPPATTETPTTTESPEPATTTESPITTETPTTTEAPEPPTPTEPPATTETPTTTEAPWPPTTNEPLPTTGQPTTTEAPKPSTTNEPPTTTKTPTTTEAPKTTETPTNTEQPTTVEPLATTETPTTTCTEEPVTAEPQTTTEGPTEPPISTGMPTTAEPQTTNQPSSKPPLYNYDSVLHDSILFYEAQRSGKLPPLNRVPWRKDSAMNDRGQNGEDLTGGWYDAGDYVKFGFPMAFSVTMLSWGLVEYKDAYEDAGELDYMLDCIKWPLDYFMKAHTKQDEFYGQVGDGHADHAYWGRPEDMTMARPAWKITPQKPGSDLAAETAAALAAASIAFRSSDISYSMKLLQHAAELYQFADKHRGVYSDSIPNAAGFYRSFSGYKDELVWGAAWLYRATQDQKYLSKAEQYYTSFGMNGKPWTFSWDDKKAGVQVLLAEITKKASYRQAVDTFITSWLPGKEVHYTPKGLAWRDQWGPNRYSANTAFLALVAADQGIKPTAFREFAKKQIHYMLGDSGRSFVVGFGTNPPGRPHHRSSSCPLSPAPCNWNDFNSPNPNPQTLYGALVGGPGKNDEYKDDRKDFIKNEVATDYNAGFQSAVAGLKHLALTGQL